MKLEALNAYGRGSNRSVSVMDWRRLPKDQKQMAAHCSEHNYLGVSLLAE
jgi:hypothetical protein